MTERQEVSKSSWKMAPIDLLNTGCLKPSISKKCNIFTCNKVKYASTENILIKCIRKYTSYIKDKYKFEEKNVNHIHL